MALPMDEQRILDEMERMLAADDPRLAARLAAFGRPGPSQLLRTTRARLTVALMAAAVIAAVAVVVYLMSAFRLAGGQHVRAPGGTHPQRVIPAAARNGSASAQPVFSASPPARGLPVRCLAVAAPSYCRVPSAAAPAQG